MQGMQNASVWIMYLQKLEYNNDSGAVAATDEDDTANYVFDYNKSQQHWGTPTIYIMGNWQHWQSK